MTLLRNPIQGAKGGQGTQSTPSESPDTLHDVARIRIVDLLAEGELAGFVHGATNPLRDVYLNETPICNADDSFNFTDIVLDSRTGTQSQDPMAGFGGTENEIGVGVELTSTTPWSQAITNLDLSAVRLRLSVDSLQKSDATTGDITGYTILYKIEVSTDGGAFVQVASSSIGGKTTSEYDKTHRIPLPTATTGWTLRVTRTTPNQHLATISDTMRVQSYTEIVDAVLRYPNSAVVGIIVDAKQFQSVPNRAYNMLGRIMSVPSNYNPTTRVYTGVWDGTFKPAWTNNPAWVFYDLVLNARFGLGKYIDAAKVNKWALYEIAQYCDELVPNGNGGTEPRFTCTLYLQTQADAYKVLSDLVSIFRGITYWSGSAIQAVADKPGDPDFEYNAANVIEGKFEYAGTGRKTRYTVALVSWNDPADFGRAKVAYVPDRDGIARYGVQPTQTIAVGATSESQAIRQGLWVLLTSQLATETVTWGVGQDGVLVGPGRICRIADPKRAGKRQGGRISSSSTRVVGGLTVTDVAVDKPAEQGIAGDKLNVMLPSGVSESKVITAIAGNVVTVSGTFSEPPVAEAAWTLDSSTLATQTIRVLSVKEQMDEGKAQYVLTGVQHNASLFDAVDLGKPISVPPTVFFPNGPSLPPIAVAVTSFVMASDSLVNTILEIGWDRPVGAVAFHVSYRRSKGNWSAPRRVSTTHLDLYGVLPGVYEVTVTALNALGVESPATISDPYTVNDPNKVPGLVDDLSAAVTAAQNSANAANADLANIAADGVLTPVEKKRVVLDYTVITTEQAGIDVQATAYGVTTTKTTYDAKVAALTAYLGTLTAPTAWNNVSGNTTIDRTAFRAAFSDVYTARQALLNAIYAGAKTKADNAQNDATNAINNAPVVNPKFNSTYGWTFDTAGAGEWTTSSGANSPESGTPTFLVHTGQAGQATTTAHNTSGGIAVKQGQGVSVAVSLRALGVNVGAKAYARIGWYNSSRNPVGNSTQGVNFCTLDAGTNYFAQGVSKVFGFAPAGATIALVEIEFDSHTSGTFTATNAAVFHAASSADEIPESDIRKWAADSGATNGFNKGQNLIINPSGASGFVGWAPNWIGGAQQSMQTRIESIGPAFAVNMTSTGSDQGVSQTIPGAFGGQAVTFSCQMYNAHAPTANMNVTLRFYNASNAEIDASNRPSVVANSADAWSFYQTTATAPVGTASIQVILRCTGTGTGLSRWAQLKLEVGTKATPFTYSAPAGDQLAITGSGYRLGDLRNQVMVGVGNYASGWTGGGITYSASTTSATLSVAAGTLRIGSTSVAYNAANTTVSGSAGATRTYYLYYDDDGFTGGAKALNATTSQITSLSADGRVLIGTVTFTFPTSGTGSGGGTSGCPSVDAWVLRADPEGKLADAPVRAGDVQAGHYLRLTDGRAGLVTFSQRKLAPCVRVVAKGGKALTCSTSAPLELAEGTIAGDCVLAPDAAGRYVRVLGERPALAARIDHVTEAGHGWIQHITCQNACFWAGDDPDFLFGHHNLKPLN